MRIAAFALLLTAVLPCRPAPPPAQLASAGSRPPDPGSRTPDREQRFPLRVEGTGFVDSSGKAFQWRGTTAFQLAEMIASSREQQAIAYLDWAKSEDLSVVRVLLMAQHLFKLTPEAGRQALPRLLDLAKARGIAVEAVALADTKDVRIDFDAHVREIGRIALEKGNAFVEIANEPGHATQDVKLHDPGFAKRLASLVPDPVLVALGSVEYGEGYGQAGDYATTHLPRGSKGWEHVHLVAEGVRHVYAMKKPVISDEPIGAGHEFDPGRRDNDPARFAAAAALTRLTGMGATFHYEGGLYARLPTGRETACLAAWRMGLALLDGVSTEGEFAHGERAARVAKPTTSAADQRVYARVGANDAVVLVVGSDPVTLEWASGWKVVRLAAVPGASVAIAARNGQ